MTMEEKSDQLEDDRYKEQAKTNIDRQLKGYMLGREWYKRFEEELGKSSVLTIAPNHDRIDVHEHQQVLEAAKKASGLND